MVSKETLYEILGGPLTLGQRKLARQIKGVYSAEPLLKPAK